jgi:hypothetical protein
MSQLGQLATVVGDPTDPAGTLQPNLPPEPETGDNFDPFPAPEFSYEINLYVLTPGPNRPLDRTPQKTRIINITFYTITRTS